MKAKKVRAAFLESGASDVYFEDSIEILVNRGDELDEQAVKSFLEENEVEFTALTEASEVP